MSLHIRPRPGRATVAEIAFLVSIAWGPLGALPVAAEEASHDHHAMHGGHSAGEAAEVDHSAHRQAMQQTGYERRPAAPKVPAMELVDMRGQAVTVDELLNSDQPTMVNFIFTSCATICPVMSASFYQARSQMGGDAQPIRWVSISIDPEYDTPQRLRDYARRFEAGPDWTFVTGDPDHIVQLQKAFDVYRGGKMNHMPVTFLRAGRDQPWVRLDGLASGSQLLAEYRKLAQP